MKLCEIRSFRWVCSAASVLVGDESRYHATPRIDLKSAVDVCYNTDFSQAFLERLL